MFPGAGGGNGVTISINGNSASLVDALKLAADQMDMARQASLTLADAAKVMGDAFAQGASAWLDASTGAAEYGAKLEYLRAQIALTEEQQAAMAGTLGGGMAGAGGGGFLGGIGGMMGGGGLIGLFGGLGDVIEGAAGKMMGFVEQAGSMLAGLVSFSILNDVIQEVQGFADALVTLNVQTEKNVYSWKYLYGGMANAEKIADWTKSFSMNIPYTRQSLLQAITNLAPMGLSVAGLEHYMPMIADLGATRAPNLDISQVAQVIMSASMGYTRMLKYDLKINPEDLIKYGLDATQRGIGMHINNPETLLPALERYAAAHHLLGAAKDISHETFWGAWSSFIDRIQNFELDTGHGLFGGLKTDLTDLSSWIDTHSGQIARFSDLLGGTLVGAFKFLTTTIGDFMTGVGQSGLFAGLNDILQATGLAPFGPTPTHVGARHSAQHLHPHGSEHAAHGRGPHDTAAAHDELQTAGNMAPPTPAQLSGWQQAGQVIGGALKSIGEGWDTVSKMFSPDVKLAVSDLGDAFQHLGDSLTPQENETLQQLGGALLAIPWLLIIGWVEALAQGINLLSTFLGPAITFFTNLGDTMMHVNDSLLKLGNQIGDWAHNLIANFLQWGGDLIKNLIKGIEDHIPGLSGVLNSISAMIPGAPHGSEATAGSSHLAAPIGGYGAASSGGSNGTVTIINHYQINAATSNDVIRIVDEMQRRQQTTPNSLARVPGGMVRLGALGGIN